MAYGVLCKFSLELQTWRNHQSTYILCHGKVQEAEHFKGWSWARLDFDERYAHKAQSNVDPKQQTATVQLPTLTFDISWHYEFYNFMMLLVKAWSLHNMCVQHLQREYRTIRASKTRQAWAPQKYVAHMWQVQTNYQLRGPLFMLNVQFLCFVITFIII